MDWLICLIKVIVIGRGGAKSTNTEKSGKKTLVYSTGLIYAASGYFFATLECKLYSHQTNGF